MDLNGAPRKVFVKGTTRAVSAPHPSVAEEEARKYPRAFVRLPETVYDPCITYNEARRLAKQYNVSGNEIMRRFHAEKPDLLFRHTRLVPHVLSHEELLSSSTEAIRAQLGLSQSAALQLRCYTKARLHHRCARQESASSADDSGSEVDDTSAEHSPARTPSTRQAGPTAVTAAGLSVREWRPVSWTLPPRTLSALSIVASQGVPVSTARWGLALVEAVQQSMRVPTTDDGSRGCGIDRPLFDRFSRLPLTVLQRCIGDLETARARWEAEVSVPARDAAEEMLVELHQRQLNTLAFNVCLWQRRHPLEVVTMGIDLYRREPGLFQQGVRPPIEVLDALLESVTAAMEPELAQVHHVLRCDVLMTHPVLAFDAQHALMRAVQSSCVEAGCNDSQRSLPLSHEAMSPQDLLVGYVAVDKVPDAHTRFTVLLTDEQYAELRQAFEAHKRDGVLRLLRRRYACSST